MRAIRRGERNNEVKQAQERLNALGFSVGADGAFGARTEGAVRAFQRAAKLPEDGVVGAQTWAALDSADAPCAPAPPSATVTPVRYAQGDPRWGKKPYTITGSAKQTIGSSGCGPTCAAMALTHLLGREVLPPEMCDYALEQGFRTPANGTEWGFFRAICKSYGLNCEQTDSIERVKKALTEDALVIASMRPGNWTSGGHFILAYRVVGDRVYIHDPAGRGLVSQRARAKLSLFHKEHKEYFIISRKPASA